MMGVVRTRSAIDGGMNAVSSFARGNNYEGILNVASIGVGTGSGYFFRTSKFGKKTFSHLSGELLDTNVSLNTSLLNRELTKDK